MELYRSWKVYALGPIMVGLALCCALLPWSLRQVGRELVFGDWLGYAMAAGALLAAVPPIRESRQQFAVRIDEDGIAWSQAGRAVRFGWHEVAQVGLERPASVGMLSRPSLLTVWVAGEDADDGGEPDVRLDGLAGFRIADIDDVKQSRAEVVQALRRYAGRGFSGA